MIEEVQGDDFLDEGPIDGYVQMDPNEQAEGGQSEGWFQQNSLGWMGSENDAQTSEDTSSEPANSLPYHPIWNPFGDRYHDEAVSDTFNENTNPRPFNPIWNPTGDKVEKSLWNTNAE